MLMLIAKGKEASSTSLYCIFLIKKKKQMEVKWECVAIFFVKKEVSGYFFYAL